MFEIISKSLIFAENSQNGENNCKTASNQFGNVVYSALCIVAETKWKVFAVVGVWVHHQ